jgi:hypothetical protein
VGDRRADGSHGDSIVPPYIAPNLAQPSMKV